MPVIAFDEVGGDVAAEETFGCRGATAQTTARKLCFDGDGMVGDRLEPESVSDIADLLVIVTGSLTALECRRTL